MKSFIWGEKDFPITQNFGPTEVAAEPSLFGYSHYHRGIDIAMPTGTPLFADQDGTCQNLKDQWGANYQFIVHPDNTATLYVHLNDFVASGQVTKGQLIAHSGNTGNSSGPHLHFERRSNSKDINSCVNPLPWLGGETMIDPKYYSNGELFKYSDEATVYWKIPSNEAYNANIGDQTKLVTIGPDPVPVLNKQIADLQKRITTDQQTIKDLQDKLTTQPSPTPPSTTPTGATVTPSKDLLRGLIEWFVNWIKS